MEESGKRNSQALGTVYEDYLRCVEDEVSRGSIERLYNYAVLKQPPLAMTVLPDAPQQFRNRLLTCLLNEPLFQELPDISAECLPSFRKRFIESYNGRLFDLCFYLMQASGKSDQEFSDLVIGMHNALHTNSIVRETLAQLEPRNAYDKDFLESCQLLVQEISKLLDIPCPESVSDYKLEHIAKYAHNTKRMSINPGKHSSCPPENLMEILTHEIYHASQHHQVDIMPDNGTCSTASHFERSYVFAILCNSLDLFGGNPYQRDLIYVASPLEREAYNISHFMRHPNGNTPSKEAVIRRYNVSRTRKYAELSATVMQDRTPNILITFRPGNG